MISEVSQIDDMTLVQRSREGDMSAFEMLFNRYQKRIYNLIYRMVGNEQDAGDLTQEVFVRVYNSINTVKSDSSFAAWIRTVAVNICRDFFRKRGRTIKADSIDATLNINGDEIERDIADWSHNPESMLEKKDLQDAVSKAILTLSQQHKEVVALHHIEGLDVNEIARDLKIPVGTVKSRLARAREELKRKLGHYVS
ncbi:MAG: RNA polymerase sigma factor [Armatimonadota bacterium]